MKAWADRPFDVLCVGEALVDFLPEARARRVRDVVGWTRCSGGSPANVAIGLARLGARAAFLGVVGDDEFGLFLRDALASEGVDVRAMRLTRESRTGLVFITLDEYGERSFTDYRKPSAELLLARADLERFDLSAARGVHLVTNSLVLPEASEAARELVRRARKAGCLISCDPNIRSSFWDEPARLRELLDEIVPSLDVIKVADDETEFIVSERDPERAVRKLGERGVKLAIVTRGPAGALVCRHGKLLEVPAPRVAVVDQTGAGDGFDAGLLSSLTREMRAGRAIEDLPEATIVEAVRFGCRVGARVVTKLGAVAGLPRLEELV